MIYTLVHSTEGSFCKLYFMSKTKIKNAWHRYLRDRGLDSHLIAEYIPYINNLIDNGVPVILELEHLSSLMGIKYEEFIKIVNSPEDYYREFSIPKKRGGKRLIKSPYPSLLSCQKWIYENILLRSEIHDCAHGFVHKKSIITNATAHLNSKALLKMDLSDFFGSISINWVINYFNELGYAKNVCFYLASICCVNGALPQGAPTSPYLSNILVSHLDLRLEKLSQSYSISYTRYADDLTFSGNYIPHNFISIVENIVGSFGLQINESKTRLLLKKGQRIVTGISVANDTLKIPREMKRNIRKEVHFIRKYGYLSHVGKLKITNPSYLDSLMGKINFWLQVEPEDKFALASLEIIKNLRNA